MTGLKKRVVAGFVSIVGVLIISGVVSFVELSILSNDTDDVLGANDRSKLIASAMITNLRSHSNAFVQMTAFGNVERREEAMRTLSNIDSLLLVAHKETLVPAAVDSIAVVVGSLRELAEDYITEMNLSVAKRQQLEVRLKTISKNINNLSSIAVAGEADSVVEMRNGRRMRLVANRDSLLREQIKVDSLDDALALSSYYDHIPIIDRVLLSVDDFVVLSLQSLLPGAEQLHNNAYRSVTPVFISLVVMIAIVLMLFYFMMIYCVNPIVEMNNALKSYLGFKVPFAPKCVKRDEVQELNDNIEQLILQGKRVNKLESK